MNLDTLDHAEHAAVDAERHALELAERIADLPDEDIEHAAYVLGNSGLAPHARAAQHVILTLLDSTDKALTLNTIINMPAAIPWDRQTRTAGKIIAAYALSFPVTP